MLVHLLIGIIATGGFALLVDYTRKKGMAINWWQWLLTILGFLYAIFVLEVIYGFMVEGVAQAALVMGVILAIVAIVWGVLLGRFVFAKVS